MISSFISHLEGQPVRHRKVKSIKAKSRKEQENQLAVMEGEIEQL
jgi:hypothetical protein